MVRFSPFDPGARPSNWSDESVLMFASKRSAERECRPASGALGALEQLTIANASTNANATVANTAAVRFNPLLRALCNLTDECRAICMVSYRSLRAEYLSTGRPNHTHLPALEQLPRKYFQSEQLAPTMNVVPPRRPSYEIRNH